VGKLQQSGFLTLEFLSAACLRYGLLVQRVAHAGERKRRVGGLGEDDLHDDKILVGLAGCLLEGDELEVSWVDAQRICEIQTYCHVKPLWGDICVSVGLRACVRMRVRRLQAGQRVIDDEWYSVERITSDEPIVCRCRRTREESEWSA